MLEAPEQTPEQERELMLWAFKGNQAAVDLCMQLAHLTQVWDDLIDRDRPVDDDAINRAFWNALVEIPANPFYRHFFDALNPVVQTFIADWHVSNNLMRVDPLVASSGAEHWASVANVLRDSFAAFVVQCAHCIGGYDWMREVAIVVRRKTHTETFQEFMK